VNKGEEMNKYLVRIAAACVGFAAMAITAKAQAVDQAIVNVPYQFVVAGTTLPAGTYRLSRFIGSNGRQLLLSSREQGTGVFVLPIDVENARDNKARFIFEQVGGQYFLTKIATADHVFVLPVSREALLQAQMKSRQSSTTSGVSGRD
jgi:hypothetical protein